MLPWGHLALGYLLYSGLSRVWRHHSPPATGTVALAVGTQFPDLVDKPLAWWFGVLPDGRSLGHSLLVGVVVLLALRQVAKASGRGREWVAFALGYLSHLFGDTLSPLVQLDLRELGFLGWPLVPAVADDHTGGIVAHFANLDVGVPFWAEFGLALLALGVWYREGAPGLRLCWQWVLYSLGVDEVSTPR